MIIPDLKGLLNRYVMMHNEKGLYLGKSGYHQAGLFGCRSRL